jgi:hypothetical protein
VGCAQCSLFSMSAWAAEYIAGNGKKDPVNLMQEMSHYRLKFNVIAGKTKKHLYRLFVN